MILKVRNVEVKERLMIVADFKDRKGKWVCSFGTHPNHYTTVSGSVWKNMKARCKVGGAYQKTRPTYIGCSISDEFLDFQKFVDWHIIQTGYATENYELDKDFLYAGNKVYSPENCILLPKSLNSFLLAKSNARGDFPLGVCLDKYGRQYQAQINIDHKITPLGTFDTVDEAFLAYKTAKEAEATRWVSRINAGEFVVDNRVVERLKTIKVTRHGFF